MVCGVSSFTSLSASSGRRAEHRLARRCLFLQRREEREVRSQALPSVAKRPLAAATRRPFVRSEERRVGKEWHSLWRCRGGAED